MTTLWATPNPARTTLYQERALRFHHLAEAPQPDREISGAFTISDSWMTVPFCELSRRLDHPQRRHRLG